ncbi:arylsulfatase [Microbacterium sp. NPDC058062]|uniref:arylsulfatase n=1 Tax=Microbacterium sp. NPDC058062 TaxID=3346320 RepID=UPI0036DD20E4
MTPPTPAPRPDVIVILVDDLGFSDLASYGGEIPTPNLDRLAERGVRLSSFYTTPRCSPTRAALLTGRPSHEVGIGVLTRPVGYRGSLDPEVPTLATMLSEAGYATALAGKWHLSSQVSEADDTWPTRRGFDRFYGIIGGGTSYFAPKAFFRGEQSAEDDALRPDFYLTHALADEAVDFVREQVAADSRYFLYLALTAPHWPLQAPADDIQERSGDYDDGWDALRERRRARQAELGLFPESFEPAPRDDAEPAWPDAGDPAWQARRMEVYAAQVVVMDRSIGRLLDELDRAGRFDDTLLLFLSDNGAEAMEIPLGRRFAPHVTPDHTRDGDPVSIGNDPSIVPGAEDTYASYGRAWANLSNTPFRLYKSWVHEGGIAAPMIASWPAGGIGGGGIRHEPAHVTDLLPTIAAAVGAPLPDRVTGASLVGLLQGERMPQRDLCWEHIGNAAIRRGRHKLVREYGGEWELYDLDVDRAELRDLAADHPELVAELARAWQEWAGRHGVIPFPELVAIYEAQGLPAWQATS